MKKLLTSLFVLMFTVLCIPTCAFAATDFYAMEINEDNGETIGEKLYSVDLRGEQSIFLVFYSGDELIDREDLEIKGLYPDTEAVDEFIDDIYASNKANKKYEYEYEDNLVCINGFLNYEETHQVSYEDASVEFNLVGLYYRLVTDKGNEGNFTERTIKYYALRDFQDRPYHYIKFYDDGELLDIKDISFIDENGVAIDESIISGDYVLDKINAWKISYTDNVKGSVILNSETKTYTMPVNLKHFIASFCNYEDDEITKFIYKPNTNETFYLFYNYLDGVDIDKIVEVDNADKVEFVEDTNGKIKFTVKECQTPYTYSIKVNDRKCEIEILPPEYAFHAKKVTIDETAGTYTVDNEILNKIGLKEDEVQFVVFYNNNEQIELPDEIIEDAESEEIKISLSKNSIIKASPLYGYVYEVECTAKKVNGIEYTIRYADQEIEISEADEYSFEFYQYIKTDKSERFQEIGEFIYEKGQSEVFYIYSEESILNISDIIIDKDAMGKNEVILTQETLNVKGDDLNVIKVTVTKFVDEFNLVAKCGNSIKRIKVEQELLPLTGFYLDYTNKTEDTFLGCEDGENDLDYVYVSGDVFYYIREEDDSYISSGDRIAETTLPLDIDYVKTGKIDLRNGITDDRYAIRFTVPIGTRGNFINEKIRVFYTDRKGNQQGIAINVTFDDAYDQAPVGEENLEYKGEEYAIGFVSGDTEIISKYKNEYPMFEEGQNYTHTVKIPIKIFKVEKTNVADTYVETDLYGNVDDLEVFIAMYNPYDEEYEEVTTDVSDYISVECEREKDGASKRWYINLSYSNLPAEYWIVANLIMDDGNEVEFAMKYDSKKVEEESLDLNDPVYATWGIEEINDYIEKDIPSATANVINIKLNPNVAYGANGDETMLKLKGDKAICIDGNGATVIGRVSIDIPKDTREGEAVLHQLTNIHFVSEASMTSGDEDNICLDGLGQVRVTKCSFENYYKAVNMYPTEQRRGDVYGVKNATDSCIFKNNKYGIYIDGKDEERLFDETSSEIKNCKFIGNYEGIHIIEQEELERADQVLEIYHSEFIDNTYDIVNRNGIVKYLAYGCLFAVTSNEPGEIIKVRKPQTVEIIASYVYREQFLNTDSNGFIDGKDVDSKVAYAPLDAEGKSDNFSYQNKHVIGVNILEFNGIIIILGEYDMNQKQYQIHGVWNFGK